MEPPFSAQFGDIYFSVEDGLAETRHVFLDGNGLPERWAERKRFTICETGFGTGLNFLAALDLFGRTAPEDAMLDYIAVELYPLTAAEIGAALGRWRDQLSGLDMLLAQWPLRVPGFHRLHFPRARLTLIFDDVHEALPQVDAPAGVDAWFLDGFAPAKNPDMWAEPLYAEMNRLSAPGASIATFTAAGAVRRGLAEAGFQVEKVKGYGRKRDMTVGRFVGRETLIAPNAPRSVGIIGAGLAGAACAHALKRRRIETVVYDRAGVAAGASGNALGLCNPRFSALRTPQSDFYTSAYAMARRVLPEAWACGSLHLVTTPEKDKRFASMLERWRWNGAHMRMVSAEEASVIAGIAVPVPCLWLPDAQQVSPRGLCHAYVQEMKREEGDPQALLKHHDAVILANGPGVLQHCALPLHTVRGQATMVEATATSRDLRVNLCFGGYISAPHDGTHMVGSSFQKWLDHTGLLPEDDAANLARLAAHVPSLAGAYRVIDSRAGLRVASQDHMPIAGNLGQPGFYVSTAHGSHGIISSQACAELLADQLDGSPLSLSAATVKSVSPGRLFVIK